MVVSIYYTLEPWIGRWLNATVPGHSLQARPVLLQRSIWRKFHDAVPNTDTPLLDQRLLCCSLTCQKRIQTLKAFLWLLPRPAASKEFDKTRPEGIWYTHISHKTLILRDRESIELRRDTLKTAQHSIEGPTMPRSYRYARLYIVWIVPMSHYYPCSHH